MIKLDDLNPANTFERRLLEYLVSGGTIPIKVEHVGQADLEAMQARIDALAQKVMEPQIITVSEQSQADLRGVLSAIDALESLHMDLLRKMQSLAAQVDTMRAVLTDVPQLRRDIDHVQFHLERKKVLLPVDQREAS